MAEPFLSEIRLFSFGFAPKGWALCTGQLLPINQVIAHDALWWNWGLSILWRIGRNWCRGLRLHRFHPTRQRLWLYQARSSYIFLCCRLLLLQPGRKGLLINQ